MREIEEFVRSSVKIEKQQNGEFGYFPFHCFVEKADGHYDFIVIAGVDGVEDCYKLIAKYVGNKAKRVYLSVDFPAGGDIENDFVAVFETNGTSFNIFAIPYNTKDGTVYPRVNGSQQLIKIVKDLKHVAVNYWWNMKKGTTKNKKPPLC